MEPKGTSAHSQQPVTCSFPEPDQSSLRLPLSFLKIHFDFTLPSTPTAYLIVLNSMTKNIWPGVQAMKLLIS